MSQERLLTTPSGVDSADVLPIPAFAIVPVRALPAIAAVLLLLIAAVATNTLWALNFFHVAFGGAWTAIDLFVGFVIGPILGRLSTHHSWPGLPQSTRKCVIMSKIASCKIPVIPAV